MSSYDAHGFEHHEQPFDQSMHQQSYDQSMNQHMHQNHHMHQHHHAPHDGSGQLVSRCGCEESINQIMISQGMTPSLQSRGLASSVNPNVYPNMTPSMPARRAIIQPMHTQTRNESPYEQFSPPLRPSQQQQQMQQQQQQSQSSPVLKPSATQSSPNLKPQSSPNLKPRSSPSLKPQSSPSLKPQSSPNLKPQSSPSLKPSSNPSSPQVQPLEQTGGSDFGHSVNQLTLPSPMIPSRNISPFNRAASTSPGFNVYQNNAYSNSLDDVAVMIDTPRSMRLDPEYMYTPSAGNRTLKHSSHNVMTTPLTIDELEQWNSDELSDFSEPVMSPKGPRSALGRFQDRVYSRMNYFGAKFNMFTTWIYVTLNLALDPDFNADEIINNSIAQSVNMVEFEKAPMSRRTSIASIQTNNDTDSVVHWSPPPSTRGGTPRYLSNAFGQTPRNQQGTDPKNSLTAQGSTVSEMGTPLTLGGMTEQFKETLHHHKVPATPRSLHIHGHSAGCPVAKTKHRSLIKLLARGLMTAGIPMHVTDFYLKRTGKELINQSVTVVTLPNCVLLSFGGSTLCHLVDAVRPGLSLSRMVDTVHVAESILACNFSYEKSVLELRRVNNRGPLWSVRWQLLSMVILSVCATPLFAGGLAEMIVAGVGSFLISVMEQRMMTNPTIARGHDLLSGLFCSLLAIVTNLYIYKINVLAACFGGVLWVLPGLRVCMGMIDLSSGHMASGSAKLMSALLTAVNLGIGITCGLQAMSAIDPQASITDSTKVLPDWTVHLFVVGCIFPACVLMDAPTRHSPALAIGMVTAYEISALSSPTVGTAFGAFFASCGAGLLANIWGRITPHPGVEFVMFSVLLILPGSIGVKSMLASDTLSSVDLLLQMIQVTIAIVTGLLASNAIVRPKRMM